MEPNNFRVKNHSNDPQSGGRRRKQITNGGLGHAVESTTICCSQREEMFEPDLFNRRRGQSQVYEPRPSQLRGGVLPWRHMIGVIAGSKAIKRL